MYQVLRHKLLLAESELSNTRQLLERREAQPLQDEIALMKQKLLLAEEEKAVLHEEAQAKELRAQKENELLSLRLSVASGQGNSEISGLNDKLVSLTRHCEAQERKLGELQGELRVYKSRCEELQVALGKLEGVGVVGHAQRIGIGQTYGKGRRVNHHLDVSISPVSRRKIHALSNSCIVGCHHWNRLIDVGRGWGQWTLYGRRWLPVEGAR